MAIDVKTDLLKLVTADGVTVSDFDVLQGTWSVEQYLRLTDASNQLIEFADSFIKVLPVPTTRHQAILGFLYRVLYAFVYQSGGAAYMAPLRLLIREGKFREPDLMLILDVDDPRRQNDYWLGADLAVEIVSPSSLELGTLVKRDEYAERGIAEYWIVNPEWETITVLYLEGGKYTEHGVFARGDSATSTLMSGLSVAVSEVFETR